MNDEIERLRFEHYAAHEEAAWARRAEREAMLDLELLFDAALFMQNTLDGPTDKNGKMEFMGMAKKKLAFAIEKVRRRVVVIEGADYYSGLDLET